MNTDFLRAKHISGDAKSSLEDRPISVGSSMREDDDEPKKPVFHVDLIAPEHSRTSCSDESPNNQTYSAEDNGGCRRCDMLQAMKDAGAQHQRIQDLKYHKLLSYYSVHNTDAVVEAMAARIKRLLRRLNKEDSKVKALPKKGK